MYIIYLKDYVGKRKFSKDEFKYKVVVIILYKIVEGKD